MQQRLYSLDVFRGATVALMILVNNPGSWSHMFAPLKHAPWHGYTPTDLVFPFFLFAVGNAMAFVIPKLKDAGGGVFWKKVLWRSALIFLIGFLLNWWPFIAWSDGEIVLKQWESTTNPEGGIRIFGVLQRIAVAYFFASILAYYFKPRHLIWISLFLLFAYWGLCYFLGGSDPYTLENWFGTQIDKQILGIRHMYKGEGVPFDPEGIASTIGAIVQVVLGYLTGVFIKSNGTVAWLWSKSPASDSPMYKQISGLLITGFLLLLGGWFWSLGFPINKKIWTSSYVLVTTGLAMCTIGTVMWFTDLLHIRNAITKFFDVFGKNPLFIFVLSGALPRLLGLIRIPNGSAPDGTQEYTTPFSWFYQHICENVSETPEVGSFLYSLFFLALCGLYAIF